MAPVAASADAAVMEERISGGLSLPFTVMPTPSPQQTPETKLPAHQPSLRNVCIVCCCETTREDEPCLLRWRGLIMREIRDGATRACPLTPHFLEARPPESPCVSVFLRAGTVCQDNAGPGLAAVRLARVAAAQRPVFAFFRDCGGHVSRLPFLKMFPQEVFVRAKL